MRIRPGALFGILLVLGAFSASVPPAALAQEVLKCTGENCMPEQDAPVNECTGQDCDPAAPGNPVIECTGENCLPPSENPVDACEGENCTPEPDDQQD